MQMLAAAGPDYWPFAVLFISVVLIVVLITVLRVHAFLALILAALAVGLLAKKLPGEYGTLGDPTKERSHWLQAVELTTAEFGTTAGKIAVVIGLASIIGMCLMESGAADKVVRVFLKMFGEKRAGLAVLISTYIVSIPIFFDTIFMLLVPLAKAMRLRTGKDYLLYIMAICVAGVITHSMVAPHPGPLAMAEALKVDLGLSIIFGLATGLVPLIGAWFVAKWLNTRMEVPLRETPGAPLSELEKIVAKREEDLPPFYLSILPVILPVILIAAASTFAAIKDDKGNLVMQLAYPALYNAVEFLGNKNIALLIGTIIAMGLLVRQKGTSFMELGELIGPPLETAGVIILITSAGGAFGLMLKNAGVGDAIKAAAQGHEINLIFLSWLVALVIRVAQGSATVAMLTTSAMMYPLISSEPGIPYHPIYIFLAIGYGAIFLSWMNDSGFWVVSRLSGFTEKETLKSWSFMLSVISVFGLIGTLILATVFPYKQ
ncbi:MAG: hypothetical protein AB1705_15820 [Verrucomicrobiota bacterium]